MGFFDSIKKVFNSAEAVGGKISSQPLGNAKSAPIETDKKKTAQNILDSGSIPAKKSVLINDEYGDKKYAFMLSEDFIEFNSHCEMTPSFQYEPYSSEKYTGYLENYPNIVIGPYDVVYDAVENGQPVGNDYQKLDNNKYFAFKTKLPYGGEILYCYGFRDGTAREREMFGLTYNKDIEGTPLEKKLMAALDEAAQTYEEGL